MLDEQKVSHVAGYLISKEVGQSMHVLKLMKLLYFVDRLSLEKDGVPISYDRMFAMQHGMVLSATRDLMDGSYQSLEGVWGNLMSARSAHKIALNKKNATLNDFDCLSEADVEIIDEVWKKLGGKDGRTLAKMQHNPDICPEWKNPNGSSTPISYKDILNCLGKTRKEVDFLVEFIEKQNSINKIFA